MNPREQYIKISLVLGWIYTAMWLGLTLFGVFRMAVGSEQWDLSAIIILSLIVGILATLLTQIRTGEKWAVWAMITLTFFFLWLEYEGLRSVFGERKFKWNAGLVGLIFVYVLNALQIFFLFRALMTWDAVGGKGFEVILKSGKEGMTVKSVKDDERREGGEKQDLEPIMNSPVQPSQGVGGDQPGDGK